MIGRIDESQKDVTVIGAGISGLLIAYALDRKGMNVTLLEAQPQAGGLIRSDRTPWGLVESAAHSILASPEVLQLCQDLGVELIEVRKDSRARFVFRNGKPRRFPLKISEIFCTVRNAFRVPALESAVSGPLTMADWTRRYLGEAALRYLISPFLLGIYGARPEEISVSAAFPKLRVVPGFSLAGNFWRLRKSRSSKRARPKMMAPREGMGDLVSKLERRLEVRLGSRFKKNHPIHALPNSPNLVLTVPAPVAAQLIAPVDPESAQCLRKVFYAPMVSATIFVDPSLLPQSVRGVGVLIPESEKRGCLGILFNSSSFAGRVSERSRTASFTMMLGGSLRPELADFDDPSLKSVIRSELQEVLRFSGEPEHVEIRRWKAAIPRYSPELETVWKGLSERWCHRAGHVLFGNYTGQVSIRGMIETVSRL